MKKVLIQSLLMTLLLTLSSQALLAEQTISPSAPVYTYVDLIKNDSVLKYINGLFNKKKKQANESLQCVQDICLQDQVFDWERDQYGIVLELTSQKVTYLTEGSNKKVKANFKDLDVTMSAEQL